MWLSVNMHLRGIGVYLDAREHDLDWASEGGHARYGSPSSSTTRGVVQQRSLLAKSTDHGVSLGPYTPAPIGGIYELGHSDTEVWSPLSFRRTSP